MQDKKIKVLLCTPYSMNTDAGGIIIWANNLVDYYHSIDCGVELSVCPMDRSTKTYSSSSIWNRLICGIKDYIGIYNNFKKEVSVGNYNIVHICSSASISLLKDILMLHYLKRRHIKSVIHFHFGRIPELSEKQNWEWKLLLKVVRLADIAITMDNKSYQTLLQTGENNVCYLPNPLSNYIVEQIEATRDEIERIPNTILYVGHVIPTKGVYELVQAVNEIPNANLRIVGKCSDIIMHELQALATRDNGNWLTFVGEILHNEVIKEMLSCDIFTLPSYTEGFPNVILESMACGCPIVATSVGAIPEMLDSTNNPCGIIVDPKDINSLRDAFLKLLANPQLKAELGKKACKRVHEEYSISIVWKQLEDIFAKYQ